MKIPIVFIGTSQIGALLLESLFHDDRFEIKLVITQIDRPAGRKMELRYPPIKVKALELGLNVYQPENINSIDALGRVREAFPEMVVLFAYGQILGTDLLKLPKWGCLNVHASLLPQYRGASPVQQALLNGDEDTGITVMQMVEKMDAGPFYEQFDLPVSEDDDAVTLSEKLAALSAQKAPDTFYEIAQGNLSSEHQDDSKASYCKKIRKADGEIDWQQSAEEISNQIKAYSGWPGSYTFWSGKRLKVLRARALNETTDGPPGSVYQEQDQVMVASKDGALALEEIQLEGKKPQPLSEFLKGHSDFVGSKLEK